MSGRRLDLGNTVPSMHFLAKREERQVPWSVVAEVLSDPHVTESHAGHVRYVRDGLTVVVAERPGRPAVLVTLLLRRREQWDREDVREHVRDRAKRPSD